MWRRVADARLIDWLFPGAWTTVSAFLLGLGALLWGALSGVPHYLWIPLGLLVLILVVLLAHLVLWLYEKISSSRTADAHSVKRTHPITPQREANYTPVPVPTPLQSVQVKFVNNSGGVMLVKQTFPKRKDGAFGRVAPGDPCRVTTYPGHRWSVEDEDGREILTYEVTSDEQQIIPVAKLPPS